MKKMNYVAPEIDLILVANEDIMTASEINPDDPINTPEDEF